MFSKALNLFISSYVTFITVDVEIRTCLSTIRLINVKAYSYVCACVYDRFRYHNLQRK